MVQLSICARWPNVCVAFGGSIGRRLTQSAECAQERFEAIRAALSPFLRTCGFRDSQVHHCCTRSAASVKCNKCKDGPPYADHWPGVAGQPLQGSCGHFTLGWQP